MKRKGTSCGPVEETTVDLPNLRDDGLKFDIVTSAKGIVSFTGFRVKPENISPALLSAENASRIGLTWQGYTELQPDHGLGVTYGILLDESFGNLYKRGPAELLSELGHEIGPSATARLERLLDELDDKEDSSGHRRIFIAAAWADTFAEQYGEVWLAAMAQHAYYIEEDDFAFGYLSALLDMKTKNESHFLRGKVTAKSAGQGGKTRSSKFLPVREAILAEMQRLIGNGFSRTNAARMTWEKGLGTSQAANKKLWDRHRKK